jgi:hypothetical protein
MFLLILAGCDGSGVLMPCQLNTEAHVLLHSIIRCCVFLNKNNLIICIIQVFYVDEQTHYYITRDTIESAWLHRPVS